MEARNCHALNMRQKPGKLGKWQSGCCKGQVDWCVQIIAPLAAVRLRRVLEGLQVIGHRYYREQNQQQYCQGNKLIAPVRASP